MANMTTSIVMELVDRVTRPVRRVQQSLAGLGRRAGLDRLGASARRVNAAIGTTIERAKGLGQRMLWMGGLAAGAVWGVERLVSGVTDVGTAVQESAERLNVGTTWLQEWTAVGRRFGVQNDALVDGLKELGLRADEFVMTGGGPAAEAFERLGIGIEALRGTAGDTEALLDLVMGRLGDIENEAARQRIFDEIFGGQGGEQMVAMLSASREELEAMMRAAHQRGEILSPEEIANSREYTNQMGDLRQSLFGIQRTVVGDLLPAITEWMERMRELATANREAVSDRVLGGIRSFWNGLQTVARIASKAADAVGGFGNLALWVAGIMSISLLGSLASAGIAIMEFGFLLATTPVGWFLAAVAGIAAAVYLIYRNWDGIAAWFGNLWDGITSWFDQGIAGIMRDLASWSPAGLIVRAIDGIFQAFGAQPLTEMVADWFTGVQERVARLWDDIQAWFSQGIGGIVRDLLSFSPAGLLMRGVDEMFQLLTGVSLSEIGGAWIDSLKSGINEQWQGLSSWLREKLDTLTGWLPDWAKEGLGIETANVPQPSVPQPSAPMLGSSLAGNGPISLQSTTRTEVGGELRIVVDSEGRPRVSEARPRGGMGFDVESGLLGVMP